MKKNSMLIITGDLQLFEQLYMFFSEHYRIELAQDELNGVTKTVQLKPSVILISYQLPRLQGIEVIPQLRQISSAPMVLIGESLTPEERIRCFEAGVDDIVLAPVHTLELYYRIKVLQKRTVESNEAEEEPNILVFGNLTMNQPLHKVRIGGNDVALTRKEFSLLWVLVRNQNQVVRKNDLVRVIWGYDHIGDDRMVDTHLNRLRKKLAANHCDCVITTIWGLGYKLERVQNKALNN